MIHRFTWWRLRQRLAATAVVVLDVDGVLTDGGLWYGPQGELSKRFDVRDGLGIRLMQHAGVEVAFLSGGSGGATEVRAHHLGIRHYLVGVKDKPVVLAALREELVVATAHMAYLGDDLNDLAVQGDVGMLIATADASVPLRRRADAVLRCKGGQGAVREFSERLLRAKGLWGKFSREGWRDRND